MLGRKPAKVRTKDEQMDVHGSLPWRDFQEKMSFDKKGKFMVAWKVMLLGYLSWDMIFLLWNIDMKRWKTKMPHPQLVRNKISAPKVNELFEGWCEANGLEAKSWEMADTGLRADSQIRLYRRQASTHIFWWQSLLTGTFTVRDVTKILESGVF